MYILFGWGKNVGSESLKYEVTDYNITLTSSEGSPGRIGNIVPGRIDVSLEIPPSQKGKPAIELFKFAKDQHDKAKSNGAGKLVIYEGREVGQPVQEVSFDKAWISDISTHGSRHDQQFFINLSIMAGKVQISETEYKNKKVMDLVS